MINANSQLMDLCPHSTMSRAMADIHQLWIAVTMAGRWQILFVWSQEDYSMGFCCTTMIDTNASLMDIHHHSAMSRAMAAIFLSNRHPPWHRERMVPVANVDNL
jgi:hypothetical protein